MHSLVPLGLQKRKEARKEGKKEGRRSRMAGFIQRFSWGDFTGISREVDLLCKLHKQAAAFLCPVPIQPLALPLRFARGHEGVVLSHFSI